MKEKIVIFGTDKMAEIAHFYFTKDSPYEIAAFTADKKYIKRKKLLGCPLVPFEDIKKSYPPNRYKMFIAIGYKKLNHFRTEKYKQAKEKGYQLVSYLSSKATHWGDTKIGENCFILENQVMQNGMKIGNNVFIWSGNHFGHDVEIGDHTFMSSHVVVCGGVKIGKSCFIGANATFRDGITIGDRCIIGAGALILSDTKPEEVYVAKPTEKYPLDSNKFMKILDISK